MEGRTPCRVAVKRRTRALSRFLRWGMLAALPLLLCLAASYLLSLNHYRREAAALARAQAARIEQIMHDADVALRLLVKATGGRCDEAAREAMNHAVFHGVYFREVGVEEDGNLLCTNLEVLPAGFDVPNNRRTPAARIGNLEILSPTKTIRGGKSLIFNWPMDETRRRFMNLLVDPAILVDTQQRSDGIVTATYLDDAPNVAVHKLGTVDPPDVVGAVHAVPEPGWHRGEQGYFVAERAGAYPFVTVAAFSDAATAQHWRHEMRPAAISGFVLTALVLLALRRQLPRHSAVDDLREGIRAGEIKVAYQPLVDGASGRVVGAEALARWMHPDRGWVMPDEFVPLAEANGLLREITQRVIERIVQDLKQMGPLDEEFRVSVNVSRADLVDRRLIELFDRLLGAGASLSRYSIELTERELLSDVAEQARGVLDELASRGARISLDDFGTGYSGLSHLRQFKLHGLKIDRSFVRAIDTEAVTASLLGTMVGLANSLELGLVAEGVETEAQRDRLLDLGVSVHQGWLYAKAMSARSLYAMIDAAEWRAGAGAELEAARSSPSGH